MFYLDSCICIDFLRGRNKLIYQKMREGSPADFQLPSIVVAELWFGAEHSANPQKELAIVAEFIETFPVAEFDAASTREYGRIRQFLGSKGQIIGDRDMLIAATAIAHRATLVTNNINEFARIPDLLLESWAEIDCSKQ